MKRRRGEIDRMESFRCCNPTREDEYPRKPDVIWCQNVLIYHRDLYKARILAQFERCLRPGGYLVLSPVGRECPDVSQERVRRHAKFES